MNLQKTLLISLLLTLLCSCVVVPKVESKYNETCKTREKKIVLSLKGDWEPSEMECANKQECKDDFIGENILGFITLPVSAIVSGSIAVVGNTVLWFRELGQCDN
ncbi:hypothetical protein [Colwellia echini]|uniref:Lipoprotein n=1 Tax=Colwellia echini TaxID=1982103 RepID=A0ABY3MZP0_9GAMM|nr:hypothetical protein [Colwellia echini]TYK66679.1 hypothetical protein CWS31_004930 [Colwellia echini]